MTLSEIKQILNGKLVGKDASFTALTTDTRELKPGDLFVAIKGENFDGHQFIESAKEKGAAGAVVSSPITTDLPCIVVENTRQALGKIAAQWRMQAKIPLLAVTGSCGKTTTKTMLTSIMSQLGPVLSSQKSFNNDIGMPLTLLQLKPEHRFAVLEMGTNHFGEIAYLTEIAKPDIAVIINIGSAHLEFFGNLAGVARAKGEIFQGLKPNGIAVINADDDYKDYLQSLVKDHSVITFGIHQRADVMGSKLETDALGFPSFDLTIKQETVRIKLTTVGEHNVSNALAASAVAYAAGATLEQIKMGLTTMQPVAKRMIWREGVNNARIIDDTYNAIPNAVHAAMDILARMPGEKIFAFGGMAELGQHAEHEHIILGQKAKQLGIQSIYAVGPLSHLTVDAFGSGGQLFADKAELITALKPRLHSNMTVLVKGSRGSKMEDVVAELVMEGK